MKIEWTFFPNQSAMRLENMVMEYSDFIEHLKNSGPFDSKFACPWIKLAQFGNIRTPKNSLRHDKNLLTITGVEADYDAETMSLDEAVSRLERANIKAIVYTSPSYTREKPRWRVLAPLSYKAPAHLRNVILGRINGVLGGVLSGESFTMSQSYYYGRVVGAEYEVLHTFDNSEEGEFIDLLDELDEIAIYKKPVPHANEEQDSNDYGLSMFELAVRHYGGKLKTGQGRRDLLKVYIASRSARGLVRDEVLALVETVIEKYFDPSDPIDPKNIFEIATHYANQDTPDQPVDVSLLIKSLAVKPAQVTTIPNQSVHFPAPFRGVMQDIVNAANNCAYKPQPELNMLAALISMAACINGEYSTRSGGRFNLYGIGSLDSGGGKDNPRMVCETIAALAGADILGRPASGAGLEDQINSKKNQLVSIDEMAHILKTMNDERAPAHLKDIGATLLKLYSSSRGAYNKRVLAKGMHKAEERKTVPNPCVSLIGFATPDGFADAFSEANLTDGLIGRMLFTPGRNEIRARRPSNGFTIPQSIEPVTSAMRKIDAMAHVQPVGIGSIVVDETPQSSHMLDELLSGCEHDRAGTVKAAKSLYARSYEKIERIAGVLAIWDDPTAPKIEPEHVVWARDMVYASDAAIVSFIKSKMFENDALRNLQKVRATIRKILNKEVKALRQLEADAVDAGFVSRSQLLRATRMPADVLQRTLVHLEDMGELRSSTPDGKKALVLTEINILDEV